MKLPIFKACFARKSHIANCFCNFEEQFVCKLAPVLQKGSLSFLFLCCRWKNELAVENFLFYTTGCALRVSCACFPGNSKLRHALILPLLIAASFPRIPWHGIHSSGSHGFSTAILRNLYGKFAAKIRNENFTITETVRQNYRKNTEFVRQPTGLKKLEQYVRCPEYNIYFVFCI